MICVEQSVGAATAMFMQGTQKQRPLTHDLLASILRTFEAKIERVIINNLKGGIYFATLVLSAENESQQKKIIETDSRPSDCIAMATQQTAPIYVSGDVCDVRQGVPNRWAPLFLQPERYRKEPAHPGICAMEGVEFCRKGKVDEALRAFKKRLFIASLSISRPRRLPTRLVNSSRRLKPERQAPGPTHGDDVLQNENLTNASLL